MHFGNLCREGQLDLDQAGGKKDLKIPLGISGISLCSQGMLLKMMRGNGSGSDTTGQAGTWHLVALVGLVGAGRAGDGFHQGRN